MAADSHAIKRLVYEIRHRDPAKAHDFHGKISRLSDRHLLPILEEAFSKFDQLGTTQRLDKLTIDLGKINPRHLQDELTAKLKSAVPKALTKKIVQAATSEPEATKTTDKLPIEALSIFLETGTLPWWATGPIYVSTDNLMEKMTKQFPQEVTEMVKKLGNSHS